MKRACLLIAVLTLIPVGLTFWADAQQHQTAMFYQKRLRSVISLTESGNLQEALDQQNELTALWQRDEKRLNHFADHFSTRQVSEAMGKASVSLGYGWHKEALMALDEARQALLELQQGQKAAFENIF